jgi:uncharacterized protein YfaP (DUF2135 family)
MQPPEILAGQMRQYTIYGSQLSNRSMVRLNVPGFTGSQRRNPNMLPVEAAADGSWLRIFIYVDPQVPAGSAQVQIQNPDGAGGSMDVSIRR